MESTLAIPKKELEAEVGLFAGWGRGALYGETAWDANKQNAISSCVKAGQRRFYKPPPMQGIVHEWSFLKPIIAITLASGSSVARLPDDFQAITGRITVTSEESAACHLEVSGAGRVSRAHADFPSATGRPELCALRFKKMIGGSSSETSEPRGQRQELWVYPTADAAYTLEFQYELLPNALSGDGDFAYGGMAHAETVKAACKAAFEMDFNDIKNGPQDQYFMERLAASIAEDRKNKPQAYSYNGDRSDERDWGRRAFSMDQTITIGGVAP